MSGEIEESKAKTKSSNKKKCIHDGHRARLFELATNNDIFNLHPHQIVELLLTYIFPRGDVNPLAHELINHYGSFYAIMEADVYDLAKIKGMNVRSAQKLSLMLSLFNYYADDKVTRTTTKINSKTEMSDYVEQILRFRKTEEMYIFGLDHSNNVRGKLEIGNGTINSVTLNKELALQFCLEVKPALVFIAHNHPNGRALPSKNDIDSTNKMTDLFNSLEIKFSDSIIVGDDGIFSIKDNRFLKIFSSFDFDNFIENAKNDDKYEMQQEEVSSYI